jgi:hypothetical protein
VALNERIALHVSQAAQKRAAADGMKRSQKLRRAPWAIKEVAHHKHSPFIADYLKRTRHRTSVAFASSHLFTPLFNKTLKTLS